MPSINRRRTTNDWIALARSGGRSEYDCWPWPGCLDGEGYGVVRTEEGRRRAHRVIFEAVREPIPDGLVIDHLCRNRACINPDHLDPVPNLVNIARGVGPTAVNQRKDRCINGHLFDDANTYVCRRGWRQCRRCHKDRLRKAAS